MNKWFMVNQIKPVNAKGSQPWIFTGRTDAEAEAPILWPPDEKSWLTGKKPWCWERLKTGGKGNDRGWDGGMTSPTQWTWVWASSRSWWWTGKPGMLQSMGSQRVRHNWATEQQRNSIIPNQESSITKEKGAGGQGSIHLGGVLELDTFSKSSWWGSGGHVEKGGTWKRP